jgi:hypothetical protein
MKFRELRAQRDTATEAYGALRRELAEAPDDASKVRVLYRRLRAMRFAKQPLHPDVANLEPLLRDLERGADLSAGKQKTLSPYWRWVLYLYGPQIREAFGTFRFLFSELVPLQLITERQFGDSEAEDAP